MSSAEELKFDNLPNQAKFLAARLKAGLKVFQLGSDAKCSSQVNLNQGSSRSVFRSFHFQNERLVHWALTSMSCEHLCSYIYTELSLAFCEGLTFMACLTKAALR